jgi:hypothetical protein
LPGFFCPYPLKGEKEERKAKEPHSLKGEKEERKAKNNFYFFKIKRASI